MLTYQLSDFDYHLPSELIAKYPLSGRSDSRLLTICMQKNAIKHHKFNEVVDYLNPEDLLIFNDTKVIPARLFGIKSTGGKVECLIERVLNEQCVLAHLKASKAPQIGSELVFANQIQACVVARYDDLFELQIKNKESIINLLHQYGEMPLPPYLDRKPTDADRLRYQTIYAKHEGAVAAPTAGLHFDHDLLAKIQKKGIPTATVTLHVGAGTFQPVRVNRIDQHKMHREWMEISHDVCTEINQCRQRGGRVIAVGTTTVRCLETASQQGEIKPYRGDTDIFIYPGYSFRCVNGLITNFHLPRSSLLMLVAGFAGYDLMMRAYHIAVQEAYRFYSYGDAMLIVP